MPTHPDIALGDTVRDTITGFTGVVTADLRYLNGCRRLAVQPREMKDGQPQKDHIFDVDQLELVEKAVPRAVTPSGGPRPDPATRATPSR